MNILNLGPYKAFQDAFEGLFNAIPPNVTEDSPRCTTSQMRESAEKAPPEEAREGEQRH
jgi:hypothetical protein